MRNWAALFPTPAPRARQSLSLLLDVLHFAFFGDDGIGMMRMIKMLETDVGGTLPGGPPLPR